MVDLLGQKWADLRVDPKGKWKVAETAPVMAAELVEWMVDLTVEMMAEKKDELMVALMAISLVES